MRLQKLFTFLIFVLATSIQVIHGAELKDLKVQCSRSGLTVHIKFDSPFDGIVYSQNYYQVPQCTYVTSEMSSSNSKDRTSFSFNVPQKGCGTVSQQQSKTANTFQRSLDIRNGAEEDLLLENTIVIQHDPDFQEAGDTARRLRCVWGAQSLQKSVNAKMPQVRSQTTSTVTVKYDYRSVNQLVDVQSPVRSGSLPARGFISSSPSQSSLVIYLKNGGQRLDANVLGCTYTNGKTGETVKLTDDDGCPLRPDLNTVFYKLRESSNPNTDLTLYTYFRGLRVSRESYFAISCSVEICYTRCVDRCRNRRAF